MKAWIFDIDGVVTDLHTKQVEYPEILKKIAEKLDKNEPVEIITGRAIPRILDSVIKPIVDLVKNKDALTLFHAEGEFGGASIDINNGKVSIHYRSEFFLPEQLIDKGKLIIEEYGDIVFFDLKKTFFTAEILNGGNIKVFKEKQDHIAERLQKLVDEFDLSNSIEVHQDTIAVNVKSRDLNKYFATKNLLRWLGNKNINPDFFYVFGDSRSDLQIGEELYKQDKKLKFIYTGKDELEKFPFEIVKPNRHYDEGTLEYLLSN